MEVTLLDKDKIANLGANHNYCGVAMCTREGKGSEGRGREGLGIAAHLGRIISDVINS